MNWGQVPPILGDESQLRELMTNLIFNAVDAMPEGGNITTNRNGRNREREQNGEDGSPTPPFPYSPTHVVLEVSDTGDRDDRGSTSSDVWNRSFTTS